jgi:hypothetical protein
MQNKLTTMGYFVKRLRDCGYIVDKLYNNYGFTDPRSWSVVIDPGNASVFCTCYQNDCELGESFFEIYDGKQYIPGRWKIKTSSIEVFVEHLVKFNINNKAKTYLNKSKSSE